MILEAVLEVASRWSEPAALSFEFQVLSFKFQVKTTPNLKLETRY